VLASEALGPVRAEVRTDAVDPRFGDRIQLVVEITSGPGVALEPMEFPSRMGHLRKVGRRDPPAKDDGPVIHGLTVEPERTGLNIGTLPPIVFRVLEGEGQGTVRALRIPAFELDVKGLEGEERPALADVGPALPPVPLPPEPRGRLTLTVILVGVGVLLALTFALWWQRRHIREPAPPPLDPVAEAQRALAELMARGLIEAGEFGLFYVELTGIVRVFVERTTGVKAPDQTTEEFLHEAEHHGAFTEVRRQALQRFLEAADLVKYAAQVPGSHEVTEAVDSAHAFCQQEAEQGAPCAARS